MFDLLCFSSCGMRVNMGVCFFNIWTRKEGLSTRSLIDLVVSGFKSLDCFRLVYNMEK